MPDVLMPRLSDSMEEGTIVQWLVEPGSEVRRGQEIVEIESDKATTTYEADADGVLEVVAAVGDTLPIGALIARIGGDGREASANGASAAADAAAEAPTVTAQPAQAAATPSGRVKASPLARRVASEHDIDLATVRGSGRGGRIVRADVEAAHGDTGAGAPPAPAAAPAEAGSAKGTVTYQELSRAQQVVARRMAEAKATIPEFTLTAEVDMTAAAELRSELKQLEQEPVPSLNDMVIRACAFALREFPRANGAFRDGRFELYGRVNIGVAVAAEDSLIVPTVFDADQRTLGEIAQITRTLAERVRTGQITPPEVSGGTFTVSNLGMYGVSRFTAVINPPQAAILAVGALAPRLVLRDGDVAERQFMPITLSCDHRILYGAPAAEFLGRIREFLEQPLAILL